MESDVETTSETKPASWAFLRSASGVPVAQQLAVLSFILLLIFGSGYVPRVLKSLNTPPEAESTITQTETNTAPRELNVDPFADITLEATSAYVWDVREQRALYQKNPDEQLPLASITKLMTALVAYELLEDGQTVPITEAATQQDGYSGLSSGESFTLRNLLDITLLSSSNDGAYAIAAAAGAELERGGDASSFVEAMNIRASELGLTQTYYRNPTGLDLSEEEGGAYGSARDTTFLMEYILERHPTILEETQSDIAYIADHNGLSHAVENTNPVVSNISGLIGSKTGYTDLAGGNLTVAFDAAYNRPVIVVVLGSSHSGRFADILKLSEAARAAVN